MTTKSFIIPLEKIREETPYGTLETGVIPTDPYETQAENLKSGRILILKNKGEFQIIAYLPPKWQVTINKEGDLRTHGIIETKTKTKIQIYEGNLKIATPIDPWEMPEDSEEPTSALMPWAKHYEITLQSGETTPQPESCLKTHPLTTLTKSPLLIWPETPASTLQTLLHLNTQGFQPENDHLTTYQVNKTTKIRALRLKKTWTAEPPSPQKTLTHQ